jgi:hypothetical protein
MRAILIIKEFDNKYKTSLGHLREFKRFIHENMIGWEVDQKDRIIISAKEIIIKTLPTKPKEGTDTNKAFIDIQEFIRNQKDDAFVIFSSNHQTYGLISAPTFGDIEVRFMNENTKDLTKTTSDFVKELKKAKPEKGEKGIFVWTKNWIFQSEEDGYKFEEKIKVKQKGTDNDAFKGTINNFDSMHSFALRRYKVVYFSFWGMSFLTILSAVLLLPPVTKEMLGISSPIFHSFPSIITSVDPSFSWSRFIVGFVERSETGAFITAAGLYLKIYIDYKNQDVTIQWDV